MGDVFVNLMLCWRNRDRLPGFHTAGHRGAHRWHAKNNYFCHPPPSVASSEGIQCD